jgi:thiamine-phosphate pyrophosphorylase
MAKAKNKSHTLHGLYIITPSGSSAPTAYPAQLAHQVEQAVLGGARLVQYRDKSSDHGARLRQAEALIAVCHRHGAVLIVNDDVELALAVGADGVHVGSEDAPVAEARERLGSEAIIGVSCYNQLSLALRAQQQGADYVAFGRFFPSRTKPHAVHAPVELLREAKPKLSVPIVAIGGITAQNGRQLILAGADMLAVVDAVFGQEDVRDAARQLALCFV